MCRTATGRGTGWPSVWARPMATVRFIASHVEVVVTVAAVDVHDCIGMTLKINSMSTPRAHLWILIPWHPSIVSFVLNFFLFWNNCISVAVVGTAKCVDVCDNELHETNSHELHNKVLADAVQLHVHILRTPTR